MTYDQEKPPRPPPGVPERPPAALVEFMMQGWRAPRRGTERPIRHAAAFARRRAALSRHFPDQALVIPTGHEKVRANDTHFRFRPGSDFFYLTGNLEPDCVLVLLPSRSGHRAVLFVEPNPGRSSETFFTDRQKGELWVGPRLGVPESKVKYGVDEARPLGELAGVLGSLDRVRVLRGLSEDVERAVTGATADGDAELGRVLAELRLIKDALEVTELRRVVASTKRGFEDVIRALPTTVSEREVEGRFALRARVEGNDVGYGTIAAAGAHACTLHWTHNDGKVRPGELLLLDAGVEGHALYTADITRTLPVSGRFTQAQREIYQLVYRAQQAAMEVIRPGVDFLEPNRRAQRVLAEGLEALGILESAAEALDEGNQFHKRYTLHNVSHMLGLDVHDCARARNEVYRYGPLQAGMVLTVEPGLYFQEDDLTVPSRYRGIGVRIEDDVLVTPRGFINLSRDIPAEATELEAWMRSLSRRSRGARPAR